MEAEKSQGEINREVHSALYGDPDVPGDTGLVQKMDKIVGILGAFEIFGKAIMWIALVIGSIGTAIAAYFQVIKHFMTKN